MTDFVSAVECVFSNTWTLLTTIHFPGTSLSIAQISIGAAMAAFSLRVLYHTFGLSANDLPKPTTTIIRGGKH